MHWTQVHVYKEVIKRCVYSTHELEMGETELAVLRLSVVLNVYTVQNPRQRVVLKETSQMRRICTHIGKILSACLYLSISFSLGGGTWDIFVDMVST